jgi:hypothetical protein
MAESPAHDLLTLDRDVARGYRALTAWRAGVASDPEAYANDEPLEPVRHAAGQRTAQALAETTPSGADLPLRDGLVAWVRWLTAARILREDDVAAARAAHEPRARFEGEPPRLANWRECWQGAVAARSAAETRLWIDAAEEAAPKLANHAHARAARRAEVARRLGASHAWELVGVADRSALRTAARHLLDATEDAARAVRGELPRDATGVAPVVAAAIGREAPEGWPARLTPRWLDDLFGTLLGGLRPEMAPLPPALGSASFARALYAFGFAVRLAGAPAAMPFALAHEPGWRVAHRLAFVFGALATSAEWQARALGVGTRTALRQARVLARTALLDARLHAARLLLGDDAAFAPADLFDEIGERVFGMPLDPRFRGAWPAARDDEPARFVGLLEAHPLTGGLRDRFDADWFRNPRAWAYLRESSAAPAREPIDASALPGLAEALARAFEEAIG